ncbi:LytR/AlgR family response regulator transcription factor [Longitalea arenae]|uniref:LytR/AlgR family response regulator transcription factor n=1 Tax=Longitalea arenae TaxID=2812558 RepID=UPI001966E8D8|nr:response regulator [Longitalea arenae]
MKCIIVDDEPQARKLLNTYLDAIPGCTVVKVCRNAVEAYEVLQTASIDVLFLDIKMPIVIGTDFLRSLKDPPLVVFTTAYDKYALEGYELNVIDYLLKPIALPRLLQAVEKIKSRLSEQKAAAPLDDHIFIRQDQKLLKLSFKEMLYVEGLQNYVRLHLLQQSIIAGYTMKVFEEMLPEQLFMRIHRSYIVYLPAIKAIKGNRVELAVIDLPIGLSYKERLLNAIRKI